MAKARRYNSRPRGRRVTTVLGKIQEPRNEVAARTQIISELGVVVEELEPWRKFFRDGGSAAETVAG